MQKALTRILSFGVAFLMLGCTTAQLEESPFTGLVQKELTFEASLSDSGSSPATKTGTVLDGETITAILWSPDDDINVYFLGGDEITEGHFRNSSSTASVKTSFRGSIDVFSGTTEAPINEQMFWAIYPYSENNKCDGKSVTFNIPAAQSCPAGSFADGQWPTMARSSGLNLPFYAICSGIKFKVAHEGVTSVTFTNRDGGAINGTVTASWSSDNLPEITGVKDGSASITVTPQGSDTFVAGSLYFVVLPVITMTEGIEITYKTATAHCTYVNENKIGFARNRFNTLYNKDTDYVENPRPMFYRVDEVIPGEEYAIYSEGYLLVKNGTSLAAEAVTLDEDNSFEREATEDILWTVESYSNGYAFANGGYRPYISGSSSGYYSSSSLQLGNGSVADAYLWNISSDFYITNRTNTSRRFYYSTSSRAWKVGSSQKHTYFYSSTGQKRGRGLAFANSSLSLIIDETPAANPLSGAREGALNGVKYSSDNAAVASVDPSTGALSINGLGTATITASAPEDDNFKAGSASYTLTVTTERVFNLENASITQFFDAAETQYTDDNWSSLSIVNNYRSNSASNRKDIPAPVSLTWASTSGSGDYTVSVYNDASRTNLEMSQTSSTTSADIYNLIPNRTYYYTVKRGGADVTSGKFSTAGRRRMMKVSDTYAIGHANNCRDLGGLKTTDGKTLKYDLVFRGTNTDATTDAEKKYLTGYMNVKMDVDLRYGSASSVSSDNGNGGGYKSFGDSWGVSYSHAGYNNETDLKNTSKTKTTFTDIISTVTAGNACYIHCYVGADRTGYICALLEAVLGVSPKDISIDYEMTSFSVVGLRTRDGSGRSDYYFTPCMNFILQHDGKTFKDKAENVLLEAGITPEQISALRKAMLE